MKATAQMGGLTLLPCPFCGREGMKRANVNTAELEFGCAPCRVWMVPAIWNKRQSLESVCSEGDDPVLQATLIGPDERFEIALNVKHPKCHAAADAFWKYWKENGETHRHGYYESTWGAINAALRLVGVRTHNYSTRALSPARVAEGWACPRPQVMGEHACKDRTQCWEPCGDLGHHEEYARPAPPPERP